jgi:glycine oxidase
VNRYDVVVIGSGIIGGSIAFELARRNLKVALLDRQEGGQEASWAAAGMLAPGPDSPATIPLVPLGRASLALYPPFILAVEETTGMSTGYRTGGTLEVLFHGDAERELSTLVALHRGLGLSCEPLPVEEAQLMEPALGRDAQAAALLPDEASVDNRALTAAVLAAAKSFGVRLFPETEVISLIVEGSKCAGVRARGGKNFLAGHVVAAAGCWTSQLTEVAPYAPTRPVRGQMAALRHRGRTIRRVLRSEHGYIVPRDHANPQKLVVGATQEEAGFAKCVTSGGLEQILGAANEIVPELTRAEILETWSGLRPGTPDQLPILGSAELDGLVIATGHFRSGILLAPVTAKLIAEWICDNKTSLDWEPFSPARFARANGSLPVRPG